MNFRVKQYSKQIWKPAVVTLGVAAAIGLFIYAPSIFADDSQDIGGLAGNITKTFENIGKLIIATSYLAGLGFAVSALFKFKQHKDNPQQVPIGTPIALLIIGSVMIFLPLLFGPAGQTIFGSKASSVQGGFTGGSVSVLPGGATSSSGS